MTAVRRFVTITSGTLLLFVSIKVEKLAILEVAALLFTGIKLVRQLHLINALELTDETQWRLVLLHGLVVVVQAANGETSRNAICAGHDDTLAAAAPGCAHLDLFLRHEELLIGLSAVLDHAASTLFVVGHGTQLFARIEGLVACARR